MHRREQRAAGLVVDVLFDLLEQAAAEVLGLVVVLFAEMVEEEGAGLFGRHLGEALELAQEMVSLPGVLPAEFGGFGGRGFGVGHRPLGGALFGLGLGVEFGRLDGGFAAGELDFRAEPGLADGPEGVFAPLRDRIRHDGS